MGTLRRRVGSNRFRASPINIYMRTHIRCERKSSLTLNALLLREKMNLRTGTAVRSPHGGMQCVSPQTAAVRHTNKVSVSQGCRSSPVVYTPLGRESICPPRERMTKLLINDARYLDILCFIQLLCLVTAGTAGEIIINLCIPFFGFFFRLCADVNYIVKHTRVWRERKENKYTHL